MSHERWKLMAWLFQEAIERPLGEREAFLQNACGDDSKLLQMINALLEADEEAGDFLELSVLKSLKND